MTLQRYELDHGKGHMAYASLQPVATDSDGDWCRSEDVAKLEARLAAADKALVLADSILRSLSEGAVHESEMDAHTENMQAWAAARETWRAQVQP